MNSKEHIEALRAVMTEGRPIEEIEDGWSHFYSIESDFEFYYGKDKYIMGILRQLGDGLSTFTMHVRENMPSPYTGFRVHLSTLQNYLDGGFDKDGWPKR